MPKCTFPFKPTHGQCSDVLYILSLYRNRAESRIAPAIGGGWLNPSSFFSFDFPFTRGEGGYVHGMAGKRKRE